MVNRIRSYISRHSFYYRILIPFSMVSILAILLTASTAWRIMGNKIDNQMKESVTHRLEQVRIYSDNYIYEQMMNILVNSFTGTSNPVRYFFIKKDQTIYDYHKIFQYVMEVVSDNTCLSSITVCNGESTVIDSTYGLCLNPEEDKNKLRQYVPYEEFARIASSKKIGYFSTAEDYSDTVRPAISLFYPVNRQSTDTVQSYIVLTLDQNSYLAGIKNFYQFYDSLLILNEQNEVILDNLSLTGINGKDISGLVSTALTSGASNACQECTINSRPYYLTWTTSDTSGWKYVSIVTAETLDKESAALFRTIAFVVFALLAAVLLLSQLVTSNVYRPIRKLHAKLIPANGKAPNAEDELSAIDSMVTFLQNRVGDMQDILERNRSIISYKLTMDLLHSHILEEPELRERLFLSGITFQKPCYCVLLLALNPGAFSLLPLEQKEVLSTLLLDQAVKRILKDAPFLSAAQDNRLAFIINLAPEGYQELREAANRFIASSARELPIGINLALSSLTDKLDRIVELNTKTEGYLRYSFLHEYGNLFTPELIQSYESNEFLVTSRDYAELEAQINADQFDVLNEKLAAYETCILENGYSYQSVNVFSIHLYSMAFQIGKNIGIFDDPEIKADTEQCFRQSGSFRETMDCIRYILALYHETYIRNINDEDRQLIEHIKEYILTHCSGEVSLAAVAETFHVSRSHLSRLFKAITGDNFSTFVIDTKLEKAAALFLEMPDKSINEIACSLGYFTQAYFTRLFKQKYGMTPSQYRKANEKLPS